MEQGLVSLTALNKAAQVLDGPKLIDELVGPFKT